MLDDHAVRLQPGPPAVELAVRHREAGVAGAGGAVCRNIAVGARRRRVEQQQHALADAKEAEHPGLAAVERQPEHFPVEPLRRVEVLDVEHGLEDPIDGLHRLQSLYDTGRQWYAVRRLGLNAPVTWAPASG